MTIALPKRESKFHAAKRLRWEQEMSSLPGVFIPGLRTVSEANTREHWAKKHKRTAAQRCLVQFWLSHDKAPKELPATVTFTRYGKRLLDDDNLARSFKAARDQVATYMGTDDGPKGGLTFRYEQQVSVGYGVRILIAKG